MLGPLGKDSAANTRRVSVCVAWEVPPSDEVHSVPVSHEVEAVSVAAGAPAVRQSVRGSAREVLLSTLRPGIKYKARRRFLLPFHLLDYGMDP